MFRGGNEDKRFGRSLELWYDEEVLKFKLWIRVGKLEMGWKVGKNLWDITPLITMEQWSTKYLPAQGSIRHLPQKYGEPMEVDGADKEGLATETFPSFIFFPDLVLSSII